VGFNIDKDINNLRLAAIMSHKKYYLSSKKESQSISFLSGILPAQELRDSDLG
jgi:hypothetical protein